MKGIARGRHRPRVGFAGGWGAGRCEEAGDDRPRSYKIMSCTPLPRAAVSQLHCKCRLVAVRVGDGGRAVRSCGLIVGGHGIASRPGGLLPAKSDGASAGQIFEMPFAGGRCQESCRSRRDGGGLEVSVTARPATPLQRISKVRMKLCQKLQTWRNRRTSLMQVEAASREMLAVRSTDTARLCTGWFPGCCPVGGCLLLIAGNACGRVDFGCEGWFGTYGATEGRHAEVDTLAVPRARWKQQTAFHGSRIQEAWNLGSIQHQSINYCAV